MITTLYGTKKGMTSHYDARGRRVGATILEVKPNVVLQLRTQETDGYNAVQLGIGTAKRNSKPVQGLLTKSKVTTPVRTIREVRTEVADVEPGQQIELRQVFKKGDAVKLSGVSKGKGFQGGVRRWGFHGGPKTHGQSDRHRAPGSIGSGTTPGRVFKGKHMAGHMGVEQATYLNVEVLEVDRTANLLYVKGGVPGPIGGLIRIENIGQIKGYIAPPEPEEVEEPADAEAMAGEEVSAESAEVVEEQAVEEPATDVAEAPVESADAEAVADKEEENA